MTESIGFYKFILFDYDGCLADSVDPWIEAIKKVSLEYRLDLTPTDIRVQFGDLAKVGEQGLAKEKVSDYCEKVISLARKKAFVAPLYKGAKKLLQELKSQQKLLGIISSNQTGLEIPLRNNGIFDYFDVIVTGNDIRTRKPDPEGIELALQKMNANKNESVFVGDSWQDLKAASNAGIDSVLYHTPDHLKYHDIDQLMGHLPKHVVSSYAELRGVLSSKINR